MIREASMTRKCTAIVPKIEFCSLATGAIQFTSPICERYREGTTALIYQNT